MTVPHLQETEDAVRPPAPDSGKRLPERRPSDGTIPVLIRTDGLAGGGHDPDGGPSAAGPERNFFQDGRHALRRRWLMAAGCGAVVAAVVAVATWYGATRQFPATAVLRVAAGEARLLDSGRGGRNQTTFELFKRTQRQYIRSPGLLAAALQRESVANLPLVAHQTDPVGWLQQIVSATFPEDSELMYLTVRCEDSQTAEALAAAIVQVYVDDASLADKQAKMNRLSDLERVLAETESSLRKKRADLRQLVDTLGTGDAESMTLDQKNAMQEFSFLWNSLSQVELDLKNVDAIKKARAAGEPAKNEDMTVSDDELELAATADRTVAYHKAKLEMIAKREENTRKHMDGGKRDDILRGFQADRAESKRKIEERKKDLRKLVLSQKRAAAEANAQNLLYSERMLQTKRKALADRIDQIRKEAAKLGRSSIDVELLRAEVKALDEMRNQVQRELHEAAVEISSAKSRISVLSPATASKEDDRQRRISSASTWGGLSFFATAALVVVWDLRRRRLNTALEVTSALRLPVLGTIPLVRRARRRDPDRDGLADAVDGIAATLVYSTPEESQRVILVTSASAGEGKTTVAMNLATSLAALGRPTLLVDFDLRRPRLHSMFGIDPAPGASDVLAGKLEPLAAVRPTEIENLSILPAGILHAGGLSARYDERVREMLGEFRTAFAHVVLDTGPVLPIVETRLFARHVDGVVLSLLRDVTEIPKVIAACELLRKFDAHILGAVMIGTPGELYYSRTVSDGTEAA